MVHYLKALLYRDVGSPRGHYRNHVFAYMHEGVRVLDIGCGYTAPDLAVLPPSVSRVGTDVVETFQLPQSEQLTLVRSNCEQLPFADASFDVVMCRSVIEHLEHPEAVFEQIARVLVANGHFIFLTPNRRDYISVLAALIPNRFHGWMVRKLTGRDVEDTFPTFYQANTCSRLRTIAAQAGLDVVKLQYLREHPHYLQINALLYLVGIAYEQVLQRPISWLRPWILGICRRRDLGSPAISGRT